jgi:hypothetical protein
VVTMPGSSTSTAPANPHAAPSRIFSFCYLAKPSGVRGGFNSTRTS